ncbi:MAG: radical SAM protein [Candidatus Eisenbacteria bacterium]
MGAIPELERGGFRAYVHQALTTLERAGVEIARWDLEGRPVGAQFEERYYRRGISHAMMTRGRRERWGRLLDESEKREVLERLRRLADEARDALLRPGGSGEEPEGLGKRLDRINEKRIRDLEDEGRLFLDVYRPVPILPPDRVLSFVVQITEGCPWNRCSFCGLYPDRDFRAKGADELEDHVRGALRLFGRSVLLRRSVFLGDGDPFVLPDGELLPLVDRIRAVFREEEARGGPLPHPRELYAFARMRSLAGRSAGALVPYRERGFRRLYIGVETGDRDLFRVLRKPGPLDALPQAVGALKRAGIAAGLIFLVGVGGDRFREAHREESVRLVSSLPLGSDDIVYLSPFRLVEGSAYARWAADEGIRPLSRSETAEEAIRIAGGFRARGTAAKAAYYPLDQFVY